MHIPDGMLSAPVWAAGWAGMLGLVGVAVRKVRKRLSDKRTVLMAVLGALIFALQMLNFPVAGGTSGHFGGGALAAILLGPWPAVLVMTAVLVIQSFMFADGGVTALGANILCIGVVAPFVGVWVYTLLRRMSAGRAMRLAGAFVAAWLSTVLAAAGIAALVALSGAAPMAVVGPAMLFWHAVIGVGEGLITAGLIAYVMAVRPELLDGVDDAARLRPALVGLAAMAFAAAGVSFVASSRPDGLEYVAEKLGFLREVPPAFDGSPLPDYLVPGIPNEALAGVLAGIVGVVITGLVLYGSLRGLKRREGGEAGMGGGAGQDGAVA